MRVTSSCPGADTSDWPACLRAGGRLRRARPSSRAAPTAAACGRRYIGGFALSWLLHESGARWEASSSCGGKGLDGGTGGRAGGKPVRGVRSGRSVIEYTPLKVRVILSFGGQIFAGYYQDSAPEFSLMTSHDLLHINGIITYSISTRGSIRFYQGGHRSCNCDTPQYWPACTISVYHAMHCAWHYIDIDIGVTNYTLVSLTLHGVPAGLWRHTHAPASHLR